MLWPEFSSTTFAVVPVLFGPLQTLLALLPALLFGLASMLFATLRPSGFKKLLRFFWYQKIFTVCLIGLMASFYTGIPWRWLVPRPSVQAANNLSVGTNWESARGGSTRLGRGSLVVDPIVARAIWKYEADKTIYASPAICGDRVIVSTVTELTPFSPTGRGAIVCLNANSGEAIWRYSPADFRATFSSPVVQDGFVVCGEGLHQVRDARVTCLNLDGHLQWQFRTRSHVESTPCIADGKVFVGAGDDGFYCLALQPKTPGEPQVLWHLDGRDFQDCESSPVVADGVVYFGLGIGGQAICAVDASTGRLLWKIATPAPVFELSESQGKLFAGMGHGNLIQSAADLLAGKIEELKASGATPEQLAAVEKQYSVGGAVWCVDLATKSVEWRFATADTVLGSIACDGDKLFFNSRDGFCHALNRRGELLHRANLRDSLVASPAVGASHVYVATVGGRLFCLKKETLEPIWDAGLGVGVNFVSSPVVSHGHVYVGTESEGLRCVGEPGERQIPFWSQGDRGGVADDEPIGDQATLAWRYPTKSSWTFFFTAPLTPLNGFLYAAVQIKAKPKIIKLDPNAVESDEQRVVWSHALRRPVSLPPVGRDTQLFFVEDHDTELPANARLVCVDTQSGQVGWTHELGCEAEPIVLAGEIIVARKDQTSLCGIESATGKMRWSFTLDAPGIGSPALCQGILLAVTERSLFALDPLTGAVLQQKRLAESPRGGPVAIGSDVLIPLSQRLTQRRVVDGELVWSSSLFTSLAPPVASRETLAVLVGEKDDPRDLFVFNAQTHAEVARSSQLKSMSLRMTAPPLLTETRLLFAAANADKTATSIFSLNPRDGAVSEWCPLPDNVFISNPLVALRGRVFVVVNNVQLLCLAPALQ